MAKKFNKRIDNNPLALKLYTEQKELFIQVEELEEKQKDNLHTWVKMEGKYSTKMIPDFYVGHGSRGYDYEYVNLEMKAKEQAEREAYYEEYIAPLSTQIKEYQNKIFALDEAICIALWGYGREEFYLRDELAEAEKKLTHQIAHIEQLRNKLTKLQNNT